MPSFSTPFIGGGNGMCSASSVSLTFAVVVIGALSVVAVETAPAEKPSTQRPKVYSSPRAVFDAYCIARDNEDWRTLFSCLTRESQELEVFETFFACETTGHHQVAIAVCKKHGADDAAINAAYCRKYKQKQGIDIAKLVAERENGATKAPDSHKKQGEKEPSGEATATPVAGPSEKLGASLPPNDENLMREVVSAQIKDKAGFFEEANKAMAQVSGIDLEPSDR